MKVWRPGRVLEASVLGAVLLLTAIFVGRWVAANPSLAPIMTLGPNSLVFLLVAYGFICLSATGVGAAGPPRLPVDVHEDRRHQPARHCHRPTGAERPDAGGQPD